MEGKDSRGTGGRGRREGMRRGKDGKITPPPTVISKSQRLCFCQHLKHSSTTSKQNCLTSLLSIVPSDFSAVVSIIDCTMMYTCACIVPHRMLVDLCRGVYYQKCHDPDCRAVNFKSHGKSLCLTVSVCCLSLCVVYVCLSVCV